MQKGSRFHGEMTGNTYTPGVTYAYHGYVSVYCVENKPAALLFMFDYLNEVQIAAMETLVAAGKAPAFVAIALEPGIIRPEVPSGITRTLRTDFNHTGPEIPNFILKELLPTLVERERLMISDNPDMRMTSGGSTGAAIAFNCCWYANAGFRRCYLSSPSVHSLSGGAELVNYVTKCEPRPLKAWVSVGEYESLGYWGHNVEAAMSLTRCFSWNYYDFHYRFLKGKVHTWDMGNPEEQALAMEWIWRDWETETIRAGELSKSLKVFMEEDSHWKEADEPFQMAESAAETYLGRYVREGTDIRFVRSGSVETDGVTVATGFGDITGLAVSCDEAFLYVTDATRREVFSLTIKQDGTLSPRRTLSFMPHLPVMAMRLGANGICCDASDNLYLATEWGIQFAPAAGNLSAILPLPEDLPAEEVFLSGNDLIVRSAQRCFSRRLRHAAKTPGEIREPENAGENAMDFGKWTAAFQPKLDAMPTSDREAYLHSHTFFSTHPVFLEDPGVADGNPVNG